MRIARDHDWVSLLAPAKLNLFLEVLARRADGFHEIETLMTAVDVCDTVRLRSRPDGRIQLTLRSAGQVATLGDVPTGSENIVVRAVENLRQRAGVAWGAEIELIKRIPSSAGLGGASSDAAATLLAANEVWRLGWPRAALAEVAAELGSDVPFFLAGPQAVCRGRGEQIEPLPPLPRLEVVIVYPPVGLSTPAVYRACRVADSPARLEPLVVAWRRGDYAALGRAMTNRLEPAAESLTPWIARLRREFAELGCYAQQMSGSGSSYFGIARHTAHARRIARRCRARGLGQVMTAHTLGRADWECGGAAA
jgi:4-diphosphocytidyl-2-C-methyl-D-erythritol kinase